MYALHCTCPTKTPEADFPPPSSMHNGRTSSLMLRPNAHDSAQDTMLYRSFRKNRHCISVFIIPPIPTS